MNRRLTAVYSAVQIFFWMMWAALMGFSSTYLLDAGLSSTAIGAVIAVCSLVSAVVQPALASLIDRRGEKLLRTSIGVMCGLITAVSLILFRGGFGPAVTGVLFGICAGLMQIILPLLNSMAAGSTETDFGIARGLGSLGYALIFPVIGWLCEAWNTGAVVLVSAFCAAGVVLSAGHYPVRMAVHREQNGSKPVFRSYRTFFITLTGVFFLYVCHVLLGNYGYQIVLSKGGNAVSYGNVGSIAAAAELPTMFLFTFLLKKRPASFWVKISGISFFLKALGAIIVRTVPAYYAVQIFQLTGWAMIQVASVYYVRDIMREEDRVKGQAFFTSALTLATVIGSLCGGWLIDTYSVRALIIAAMITGAAGALTVFLSVRSGKGRSSFGGIYEA